VTVAELTERMHAFVASKGWYEPGSAHPQTPRNLAASLVVESAEVLELFQWTDRCDQTALADELADVMLYLLQMADLSGIDLTDAVLAKLRKNADREWDERRGDDDD